MPWWLVPSSPTSPARSTASRTGASFWQTSWTVWSKARWRNVEYSATTGRMAPQREAGGKRDRVLLGDPDIDEPVRERRLELRQAGAGGHPGRDGHDPAVVRGQRDQLGREVRRVVGELAAVLRVRRRRLGGLRGSPVVAPPVCHDRRRGRRPLLGPVGRRDRGAAGGRRRHAPRRARCRCAPRCGRATRSPERPSGAARRRGS